MVPAYTKYDEQLIKVAPDGGLIQSETCRAFNCKIRTIKSNYNNFVHLVDLYRYRRMMHGAYNVKKTKTGFGSVMVRRNSLVLPRLFTFSSFCSL